METTKKNVKYDPPRIMSIFVSPDITKCMQNTGGISDRSTFNIYRSKIKKETEACNNKKSKTYKLAHILYVSVLLVLFLSLLFPIPNIASSQTVTNQVINIPILIPQEHPVINEIVDGINKGFEELGYSEPQFKTTIMDAQGVQANISTMIDAAIQKKPKFIITITTGLSKTTVDKVIETIPVVFSGVTDPVGAGIVEDLVRHGNITGASDLWPVEDQLRLIKRTLPKVKSVGIIFRPSEPNSQFGMNIARKAAKKLSLDLVERGVEDAREIIAVLDAMLTQVDAIYIGPDNLTIESAKIIIEKSLQARKPVFGGEPGTLEKGAIGVVSINYFDHGRETAKLCYKILKGTPTTQIPVFVSERGFVGLNYESAALLNLVIPQSVRDDAKKTIGEYRTPEITEHGDMIPVLLFSGFLLAIIVFITFSIKKKRKSQNN